MRDHRFAEGFRLFINFLEHEVVKTTLLRLLHIPVGMTQFPGDRGEIAVIDSDVLRGNFHDIAVFQNIVVLGILQRCRDVRKDKVLTLSYSCNQRAVLPGAVDAIRMVIKEDRKGIGAFDPGQCSGNRLKGISIIQ